MTDLVPFFCVHVRMFYLLADPNGVFPPKGDDCVCAAPPKAPNPLGAGVGPAREENPPVCGTDPNPLDAPKVPPPPPNPPATGALAPNPIAAGDPKVAAPVDEAGCDTLILTPN